MSKKLKTIAFDLDTNALKEHYKKGDWHNAYNDIAAELGKFGFERVQGSVYDSNIKMTSARLASIIETIGSKLDWLSHCAKSVRGYDQPKMIDYTKTLKNNRTRDNIFKEQENDDLVSKMREKARQVAKNMKNDSKNKDDDFSR